MNYPSLDAVARASNVELAKWYRFLPSPGVNHIGSEGFSELYRHECDVLHLISERFMASGGMTPALSKEIGLDDAKEIGKTRR
jgi:hypothetical protein